MSELVQVKLADIDPNPHRDLVKYPFIERKVEALVRSIEAVGLWEGIIGRRVGNRFQMAFGTHRGEAARRAKVSEIPLIVRDLSDVQMLQFMGRENLEDYNAEFLIMLETWEAGIKFDGGRAPQNQERLDVARLLGWISDGGDGRDRLNDTARACDGAYKLINGGHMQRTDFDGVSVKAARQLVEKVLGRIEMLDKLGKKAGRTATEIKTDQKMVANAGRTVARDYREGNVAHKDIRTEVDFRAVKAATKKDKPSPLFAHFAKEVADSIHKMLVDDRAAEKLAEMEKALSLITLEEDRLALRRIDFALAEHEQTTGKWRQRLAAKGQKVVPFALLAKEDRH